LSIGGRLSRCNVNTILEGAGAECSLDGLYLARGEQHVDFHTTIDHARPHGTSRELYKGVLDERATAVFNGKVYVRPDAQKSDAGQVNRNLLLSDSATVNTKPQLEIFADDVKCSHGAAIGRLDPDHLFFLRSRGIGPDDARRLLIFGFANEVIERIDVEPVRERLERLLWSRFHDEGAAR
jgi:Fe-S cluster assembly protein SufD